MKIKFGRRSQNLEDRRGTSAGGMGGMSGVPHIHVEARIWNPDGTYQIVDPSLMLAGYYD